MNTGKLTNPFQCWAELVRGLRQRFVAELGEQRPFSPYRDQVLDELSEMTTLCVSLSATLQHLHQHDEKAFDAFLKALETS
jgi:phosphoserine phosphatase